MPSFVKVMPNDYRRVLEAQAKMRAAGLSQEEAEMAAFERTRRTPRAWAEVRIATRWASRPASWSTSGTSRRGAIPKTRVRDWKEFHDHLPETTLQEQGARCMDCGVPFCHTGTLLRGQARRAARSTT